MDEAGIEAINGSFREKDVLDDGRYGAAFRLQRLAGWAKGRCRSGAMRDEG